MSSVSQTPTGILGRPKAWLAPAGLGVLIVLAVSAALAVGVPLHAPDMAVFRGLSLTVKVHMLAALAALLLGAVLMMVRKGRVFHRTAGWLWVALVAVVVGSSIFITQLNHGRWSLVHLFTGWMLIAVPLAVAAAKRHQVVRHRRTMMGLFYGGFAFNLLFAAMPGRALWSLFVG